MKIIILFGLLLIFMVLCKYYFNFVIIEENFYI